MLIALGKMSRQSNATPGYIFFLNVPDPGGNAPNFVCNVPDLDCNLPYLGCNVPYPVCNVPDFACNVPDLDCTYLEIGELLPHHPTNQLIFFL